MSVGAGKERSLKVRTACGADVDVRVVKEAIKSPLEHQADFVPGSDEKVFNTVKDIISSIEAGGEEKCLEICRKFDNWPEDKKTVLVSKEEIAAQITDDLVPPALKKDLQDQMARVVEFAKAQKANCTSFETELGDGIITGQSVIPLSSAGCYVPGGRYSHISSAMMTIATAKAAGVKRIVAASPPMRGTSKIQAATLYAMQLAGADYILCIGGAQAIAAMAFGLFLPGENKGTEVDIIVGPGNSFVAEAKRFLYGRIGIDMFAGPTEILCVADETADPLIIANDLVSQSEHGPTSPCWLLTTSYELAVKVNEQMPVLLKGLPEDNIGSVAWRDYGEIVVVDSKDDNGSGAEALAKMSDHYASEHTEVHCADLDWWLKRLRNYGSLFLGEETCVTYGDKISGPNHALPTLRASRYTGGLSVDKYVKKLTYQRMNKDATKLLAPLAARISRAEGMEAHARAGDCRLEKYFPEEKFELSKDLVNGEGYVSKVYAKFEN